MTHQTIIEHKFLHSKVVIDGWFHVVFIGIGHKYLAKKLKGKCELKSEEIIKDEKAKNN
jgi:hypothetical protein